ncbi:hypothetical protein QF029_005882 [Priestia megaterium]|nr:hypothetical protein [Priestia megaterium]
MGLYRMDERVMIIQYVLYIIKMMYALIHTLFLM